MVVFVLQSPLKIGRLVCRKVVLLQQLSFDHLFLVLNNSLSQHLLHWGQHLHGDIGWLDILLPVAVPSSVHLIIIQAVTTTISTIQPHALSEIPSYSYLDSSCLVAEDVCFPLAPLDELLLDEPLQGLFYLADGRLEEL